ncbi:hypothetical protein EE36_14018 [Sulfitobacter sp. EE-36]|nr:hypothetical protein EE36_14018 [Sulfitobacter sp. EE-36]
MIFRLEKSMTTFIIMTNMLTALGGGQYLIRLFH